MVPWLPAAPNGLWLEFPGKGKHIVFLAGDEEYRSEELLPALARMLSARDGFRCTVLFSIDDRGLVNPNWQTNQPGMEALRTADLCVMMLRFRRWPDHQMKEFVDYYESGRPIIALRTSTHAFAYPAGSTYARYGWQSTEWPGGFGKQVLGETWVSHWGNHGVQATRGVAVDKHMIRSGVKDLFGTTDVYEAAPPADADIIFRGEVVSGLRPTDPPAEGRKKTSKGVDQPLNSPMMPILWTREPHNGTGFQRIVTCTMGAATDFLNPGMRKVFANSVRWCLKRTKQVSSEFVGPYNPSPFGFDKFVKDKKPSYFSGSSSGTK